MSAMSSSNRYTPLFKTTTFPSPEGIDIIFAHTHGGTSVEVQPQALPKSSCTHVHIPS